jgi:hypothetical protein
VPAEKEIVEKATRDALKIMKDAGFEIPDNVKVEVNPKLQFMGYSTKKDGANIIVIARRALGSGMIEGLLIHEMAHIYRTNTNHPSHNRELLNRVGHSIIDKNHLTKNYQIRIIQQAVNNIQDLYADDLAFQAFSLSGAFPADQAFKFFLSWINDKPLDSKNAKTAWMNIGTMLDNCFALSNMTRHNIPDPDDQAENKARKFLSQTNEQTKHEFEHFKSLMTNLKENTTEKEFEKDLTNYLTRIIELARSNTYTKSKTAT